MYGIARRLNIWGVSLAVVLLIAVGASDPAEAAHSRAFTWLAQKLVMNRTIPPVFRHRLEDQIRALSEDRRSELAIALLEDKGPRDVSRALGWLKTFDRNRAIDEMRSITNKEKAMRLEWAHSFAMTMSREDGIETRLDRQRLLECASRVAEGLPASRGRIFHLTALGWSPAEIASKVGVSVNTIKTQVQRAKRFISEQCRK